MSVESSRKHLWGQAIEQASAPNSSSERIAKIMRAALEVDEKLAAALEAMRAGGFVDLPNNVVLSPTVESAFAKSTAARVNGTNHTVSPEIGHPVLTNGGAEKVTASQLVDITRKPPERRDLLQEEYATQYPQAHKFIQDVLGKPKTLWRDSSEMQLKMFSALFNINSQGYAIADWVELMKSLRGDEFLHIQDGAQRDVARNSVYTSCKDCRNGLLQKLVIAYRDQQIGASAIKFAGCFNWIQTHPVLKNLNIYELVAIGLREMPNEKVKELFSPQTTRQDISEPRVIGTPEDTDPKEGITEKNIIFDDKFILLALILTKRLDMNAISKYRLGVSKNDRMMAQSQLTDLRSAPKAPVIFEDDIPYFVEQVRFLLTDQGIQLDEEMIFDKVLASRVVSRFVTCHGDFLTFLASPEALDIFRSEDIFAAKPRENGERDGLFTYSSPAPTESVVLPESTWLLPEERPETPVFDLQEIYWVARAFVEVAGVDFGTDRNLKNFFSNARIRARSVEIVNNLADKIDTSLSRQTVFERLTGKLLDSFDSNELFFLNSNKDATELLTEITREREPRKFVKIIKTLMDVISDKQVGKVAPIPAPRAKVGAWR